MKQFLCLVLMIGCFGSMVSATTLKVPSQFPTIQSGINATVDGDTVLVARGIYRGAGNRDLDFLGKEIVVMSEEGPIVTIIDCQTTTISKRSREEHRGVYFHSGETWQSRFEGFTIRNGNTSDWGGAIFCEDSSPMITDCVLSYNTAGSGGGIACYNSSPIIADCVIRNNVVSSAAGGIYCVVEASPIITNCLIIENQAYVVPGILCWNESSPVITGCTLADNVASAPYTATIIAVSGSLPFLTDCIIWNLDVYAEILADEDSSVQAIYSDIGEEYAGYGNFNANPLFLNGPYGPYSLDQQESPCVDAGHPGFRPEPKTTTYSADDEWPIDIGFHYHR